MTLKPCPFCGRHVEIKRIAGQIGHAPASISIRCESCEIGFREYAEKWTQERGHFSIKEEATAKLINKWNTRVLLENKDA